MLRAEQGDSGPLLFELTHKHFGRFREAYHNPVIAAAASTVVQPPATFADSGVPFSHPTSGRDQQVLIPPARSVRIECSAR